LGQGLGAEAGSFEEGGLEERGEARVLGLRGGAKAGTASVATLSARTEQTVRNM
jgi:hypothetical protein